MNLDPEKILSKEALTMPHRTVIVHQPQLWEQEKSDRMMRALMQKLKQDIINETQAVCQKTVYFIVWEW